MIDITPTGRLASFTAEPLRRYNYGTDPILTGADAGAVIRRIKDISEHEQEILCVMALSTSNRIIRIYWATVGLLDTNLVHPREVFAPALHSRASRIILFHNHPSGQTNPSPEDVALTARLAKAGQLLGVPLLDHIILTKDGSTSLKELGHI